MNSIAQMTAPILAAAVIGVSGAAAEGESMDIVDTAVSAGSFSTLAAALGAGGLIDTLKGPGPFTVLAPTDDAFAALPAGTVESLLKPENKDQLVSILTYHVIPGNLSLQQLSRKDGMATVNGETVSLSLTPERNLKVDDAFVINADIAASNGVIHVIDGVLIPDGE